jgi:hypothetical protein
MGQSTEAALVTRYDRIFRLIQHRLADQIKTPFEVRLWGDRTYRFGKGEPAVKVLVKDRDGLAWAENLELARDEIVSRWGEMLYRRFRLYLWGSEYAFLSRGMDAYRVVLERPPGCERVLAQHGAS